ncbi:hypothetical protein PIB30_093921 [Stylosanthes scabra]|uniref:Uncharacterized protein n=1 Tax=Stylosanthes scabra TaxID=79078 RepID=A0ABU6UW19_9FABA|nr:hypothetical protein [Stylosanthes scabra]
MALTKSNPLAKGKTKVHRPPLRTSPRLAALRSRGEVQPQLQAPEVPAENIPTPMLSPKKCLTYRIAGEGSSKQEVIALNSESEHEKDGNLEVDAEGALPAAEGEAEEILPKNDVYDALWAMLDAKSENEAEEIPGQWDLDSVLNNWGKVEPNMEPAGDNQGPPPAAN